MKYSNTKAPRPLRDEDGDDQTPKEKRKVPVEERYLVSPFVRQMWSALGGTPRYFDLIVLSPSTSGTDLTGETYEIPETEEDNGEREVD